MTSSEKELTVPVLLILFNRPMVTKKCFDAIAVAKPKTLLIAADGPRSLEERKLCDQTRSIVEQVDWPCDVRKSYSSENLGCGVRVYSAIDWALEQFSEIIILEDDCVAEPSFFQFCENLLGHYRHDERIAHIGGFNFHEAQPVGAYSYFFSKYTIASGGWATWRRAWKYFDWKIDNWPLLKETGLVRRWCDDSLERQLWTSTFDRIHGGARDVWDYQWTLACWEQKGLAILPSVHLLTNIGFGPDATHTKEVMPWLVSPVEKLTTITHPPFVMRNSEADAYLFEHSFGGAGMRYERSWRGRSRRALRWFFSPYRALKRMWKFHMLSEDSASPGTGKNF